VLAADGSVTAATVRHLGDDNSRPIPGRRLLEESRLTATWWKSLPFPGRAMICDRSMLPTGVVGQRLT